MQQNSPESLDQWRERAQAMEAGINSVIVGQQDAIRLIVIAVFAQGHVLLEGDVGVGKTTLLRAVSRTIGGNIERIEGTVDLLPSDLVYHTYVSEDGKPVVDKGPLLRHEEDLSIFFFNEINRARPQVHSMMLRIMAERSVTAFNRDYALPYVQVFADRNRMERDETYEIPAAARDRFLMEMLIEAPTDPAQQLALMNDTRFHDTDALIDSVAPCVPDFRQLGDIAAQIQQQIKVSEAVQHYALSLCNASRDPVAFDITLDSVPVDSLVQSGASPRGMSLLLRAARVRAWLAGRDAVLPDDVRSLFKPCVGHRIFFTPVFEMRRQEFIDDFVDAILAKVGAP